jgi:hypothetical protein
MLTRIEDGSSMFSIVYQDYLQGLWWERESIARLLVSVFINGSAL